jgi:hypothetical protein
VLLVEAESSTCPKVDIIWLSEYATFEVKVAQYLVPSLLIKAIAEFELTIANPSPL